MTFYFSHNFSGPPTDAASSSSPPRSSDCPSLPVSSLGPPDDQPLSTPASPPSPAPPPPSMSGDPPLPPPPPSVSGGPPPPPPLPSSQGLAANLWGMAKVVLSIFHKARQSRPKYRMKKMNWKKVINTSQIHYSCYPFPCKVAVIVSQIGKFSCYNSFVRKVLCMIEKRVFLYDQCLRKYVLLIVHYENIR